MSSTFRAGNITGPNFHGGATVAVLEALRLTPDPWGSAPITTVRQGLLRALNVTLPTIQPTEGERFYIGGLSAEGLRDRLVELQQFVEQAASQGETDIQWD